MRSSYGPLYAALLLVISAIGAACMQQGEGGVCSPFAGNGGSSDCQDGYVCTNPMLLAPGTTGYRCCPGDLSLGTGVCASGQSMILQDAATPLSDAEAGAAEGADGSDTGTSVVDAADANASDGSSSEAAPEDGGSAPADASDGATNG